jgi:RND family efflux transporter MFP subunit
MKTSYSKIAEFAAFAVTVLLFTAFFFTACDKKEVKIETPITVETIRISRANVETAMRFSGEISAGEDIELSFQSSGKVLAVNVNDGEYIQAGQTLAVLDSTDAQNMYNAARSKLDQAEDAYNRYFPMHRDGNMSEVDWKKIEVSREEAAASFNVAKNILDNCVITAPVSGYASRRRINPGETAVPGVPIMHILSLDTLHADISIPVNEIGNIKVGMDASVSISGHDLIDAKVFDVDVSADPLTRTYKTRILINGKDADILPGMLCDVYITGDTSAKNTVITIPATALNLGVDGGYFVYVVDEKDKRARRRPVEINGYSKNSIRVTKGLSEGNIIITKGVQKLDDGVLVSYGSR